MHRALLSGSFDPFTLGHLDVVTRAAALFDSVVVAVVHNPAKTPLLDIDVRQRVIREALAEAGVDGIEVRRLPSGLLAEFAREIGATVLVRGIRGAADLGHENPMAVMNRHLTGIETLYLPGDPRFAETSSSLVKQVHGLGGDVSDLLPPAVSREIGAGPHYAGGHSTNDQVRPAADR
jgi:pantetheine-phosphate adenylyltransferase